jgi:hypothetical protein
MMTRKMAKRIVARLVIRLQEVAEQQRRPETPKHGGKPREQPKRPEIDVSLL